MSILEKIMGKQPAAPGKPPAPPPFVRKQIDPATRRLRHAGVAAARAAVKQAEARAAHALADRKEWDRKIAELIERSRGEAPQRETLADLRDHRRSAFELEAARGMELSAAKAALERIEASAPTQKQIDALKREIMDGLDARRRAVELLTDRSFAARVSEIHRLLGEPMGLGSLMSELKHVDGHAQELRRAFFERNAIGRGWWAEGPDDE